MQFMYKGEALNEPGNVDFGSADISGIGDGTVTGAIKALNSKIAYVDHEFSNIGFTAGSIGTRGAQYEWNIQEYINQGYLCVGGFVTFISNSADMQPVVFMTSATVYLNIYRATASEVSGGKIYIRILLIKN